MKELTLVVDERELNAIQVALLLLQEQIDALPEDLGEMLRRNGTPLSDVEFQDLNRRISPASNARALYPARESVFLADFPQRGEAIEPR